MTKCSWCLNDPLYETYHDHEWGIPVYDSQKLFAQFSLEAFQAGLSWITILRKRPAFYAAFGNFNPYIVAHFSPHDIDRLVKNPNIIRHRGKIEATIHNARCFLEIEKEQKFSDFIWQYVTHKPIYNNYISHSDVPVKTPLSEQISKDLKKKGFKFCGPVMIYAFMQAVGMVYDHHKGCDKYITNNIESA